MKLINKTKSISKSLSEEWKKETPKISRLLQSLSVSIGAIPLYYSSLPQKFQEVLPDKFILYISVAGLVCTFLLGFTSKKQVQVIDDVELENDKDGKVDENGTEQ
jgi:hypothetical protein